MFRKETVFHFPCPNSSVHYNNDYKIQVFNGEIGIIKALNDNTITVIFENPQREVSISRGACALELAYAITIHKAQGSEWPVVIIPIHKSFGGFMMQRNILYTAISRAKKICILVGHRDEIPKIIKRDNVQKRHTNLARFLSA
ncbi:MAG: ATP-dependent RecD-like DNA helicase [Candidatus Magnetoovum sp. WYHC-5]|nr:ATP-dependent RecD-like DNA helicase [Candidatus Magnetoovum sp. WYHC-5]